MKLLCQLFTIIMFTACGSRNNKTTITVAENAHDSANQHIINYINNFAFKNPEWDNNTVTQNLFIQNISKQFLHDMADSNLLNGIYFSVSDIEQIVGDKHNYLLKLDAFNVKGIVRMRDLIIDTTKFKFTVSSTISDSLAAKLVTGKLYYIKSFIPNGYNKYIESEGGDHISSSSVPYLHSIHSCWLGNYSISIKEIKEIFDN